MRNYFTAIFALFMSIGVMAQPQAFKYQTVVRDSEGEIVANQNVSFQMKILQGSAAGTEVYTETHTAATNQFGLANLVIGQGTVVSGDFATIDWGVDDYFLEISIDINAGTNFLLAGTSQLMAVPYALYAKNSGGNSAWQMNSNNLYFNNGNVGIGTNMPETKLHINTGDLRITNGQIDFGDQNRIINYSSADVMSVQSPGPVAVVVDNNNNSSEAAFTIRKDNKDPALATEIFRVLENGRVGIGTDNPQRMLHVYGGDAQIEAPEWCDLAIRTYSPGTDASLFLRTATDGVWANDNYWAIYNDVSADNKLHFQFNTVKKMTLTKDGYLGLGTDLPGSLLDVHGGTRFTVRLDNNSRSKVGNLYSSDDTLALVSFGNVEVSIDEDNNSTNKAFRVVHNKNSELFRVQDNGNVGIGTSTPANRFHMKNGDAMFEDTSWCYFKIKSLNPDTDPVLQLFAGEDVWSLHNDDSESNDLNVRYNNSVKLTLDKEGKLGIGTMNPVSILHVQGNGLFQNSGDCITTIRTETGDKAGIYFEKGLINNWGIMNSNGTLLFNRKVNFLEFTQMALTPDGFLGIGILNPESELHVQGTIKASEIEVSTTGETFYNLTRGNNQHGGINFFETGDVQRQWIFPFFRGWQSDNLIIRDEKHFLDVMTFQYGTGRVGIGTSDPTHTLSVNGTIRSKEVIVNTGWSDFVFEDDYNLMSLNNLELFIEKNNHLPDIPSAQDVEENGISLGNMDAKLLQKIEELTLYTIQQQKMIDDLVKKNLELTKQVDNFLNNLKK